MNIYIYSIIKFELQNIFYRFCTNSYIKEKVIIMSFFRKKRFGSKNRKNFNPKSENKQTVDGNTTEEKYETYDKKKEHEAKLWADLLKETLLPYTPENAEKIGVDCVEEKDKNYKTTKDCFYIIQMLRRLLPDKYMTVRTPKTQVWLSTLKGKTPRTSRTTNALTCLRESCMNTTISEVKLRLLEFLEWLSGIANNTLKVRLTKALTKLRPGDLLTSLKNNCNENLRDNFWSCLDWGEDGLFTYADLITKEFKVQKQ